MEPRLPLLSFLRARQTFWPPSREQLYASRLLIGSVWHIFAAIVIAPAISILNRFPNRAGSKRVRILYTLLFWMLISNCVTALNKIGTLTGHFHQEEAYQTHPLSETHANRVHQNHQAGPLMSAAHNSSVVAAYHSNNNNDSIHHQPQLTQPLATTLAPAQRTSRQAYPEQLLASSRLALVSHQANNKFYKLPKVAHHQPKELAPLGGVNNLLDDDSDIGGFRDDDDEQQQHKRRRCDHHDNCSKNSLSETVDSNTQHSKDRFEEAQLTEPDYMKMADAIEPEPASCGSKLCKRDTHFRLRQKSHPIVIVLCWLTSVGTRVVSYC